MEISDSKSFGEVVLEPQVAAVELASIAKIPDSEREMFSDFSVLLEKLTPILIDIKNNDQVMDKQPVRTAVLSLEKELVRVNDLVKSAGLRSPVKRIEDWTRDLGRSLGLVLFAGVDLCTEMKEKIAVLYKELMNTKFEPSLCPFPSPCSSTRPSKASDFVSEVESDLEIEEEMINLGIDDVLQHLKHGEDELLKFALFRLSDIVRNKVIDKEWIDYEEVIQILLNRLGSSRPFNRLIILQMLRVLALESTDNMEKMADTGSLSLLVKSLTRDAQEQREAVGLLVELSDISAVRRRLGRIQGSIVMLVTILSGDDPIASHDAAKLLTELSRNSQNALHMAEAGYFKPLVQHLENGSDMSKILMATAVSRMELTDQTRASLGKDGIIEPLVKMFKTGKLEAKLSSLNALHSLSSSTENIQRLANSGFVVHLFQLLFSVTSVVMTLQESASAILAKIAQSETVMLKKDAVLQILSLLNLSSPIIKCHLLQALNSTASHPNASKVRRKLKENYAVNLLLPFLTQANTKIRTAALNLLYTLSKDSPEEFMEQLGESSLYDMINIVFLSTSEDEKAAATGILSNLPITGKKATDILKKSNLLPGLISELNLSLSASTCTRSLISERIAGIFIHFTVPSEKKLQLVAAEHGIIPLLVKLLSSGSPVAKREAATSLAQLSQNTLALRKPMKSRWMCMPSTADSLCQVHDGYCTITSTFCLVKAGAVSPLIQILEGKDREADEAVLGALATLVKDETWENGSHCLAQMSGVHVIVRLLESGNVKAQEKALWILERIFRIEDLRTQYAPSAEKVLIDLAQNGDIRLKPAVAKVLAQLELLQVLSSYF